MLRKCTLAILGTSTMLCVANCGRRTPTAISSATELRDSPCLEATKGTDVMKQNSGGRSKVRLHAVRLMPGEDLRSVLASYVRDRGMNAAAIVSAVGSLQETTLRLADQKGSTRFVGKYEIVSLSGTLSSDGPHLHIAVSDREGRTIGGHVLEGCVIYTTAEIILAELTDLRFSREQDPRTGYRELRVYPASSDEQ